MEQYSTLQAPPVGPRYLILPYHVCASYGFIPHQTEQEHSDSNKHVTPILVLYY
jgi:hypothetical protein